MINIMAWDLTSKVYTILMLKAVKLVRFTGIIIIIHGMHAGAVYMFILFSITQVSSLKYSGYQIGYFVWGESHYWWSYTLLHECAYYVYIYNWQSYTLSQECAYYVYIILYYWWSYTLLQECAYYVYTIGSPIHYRKNVHTTYIYTIGGPIHYCKNVHTA